MNTFRVTLDRVAIRLLVLTMRGALALLRALDMLKLKGAPTMNELLMLIVMLERIREISDRWVRIVLVSVTWPDSMVLGLLLDPLLRPRPLQLLASRLFSCAAHIIPTLGVSVTGTAIGTG